MTDQERPRKKPRRSSLTDSIGDLLSNSKYSDLEIRCGGKSFKVHRNIVCARSNVMDTECDGGFMEAQTRVIKHSVFDASAMDRMLQFMYRSDYQLEPACPTSGTEMDESSTASSPSSDDSSEGLSSAEGDQLMAHVYVYAIADYYDLPTLQELAVEKFIAARDTLEDLTADDLIRITTAVYANTTKSATISLRHELLTMVYENPEASVDSEEFMSAVATHTGLQEFAAELIKEAEDRHRKEMNVAYESKKTDRQQLKAARTDLATAQKNIYRILQLQEGEHKEITILHQQVLDLLYFTGIQKCKKCPCRSCGPERFSYYPQLSGDKYAAVCRVCQERHTRT